MPVRTCDGGFQGTKPAASEQMREALRRAGDTEGSTIGVCVWFFFVPVNDALVRCGEDVAE